MSFTETRLDHLFTEVKELVPLERTELLTPSVVHGIVPQASLGMKPQQALRAGYSVSPAQPGDFVISLSSHAHGIEYCGISGGISPDYTLLRPKCDKRIIPYLKYALKSSWIIQQLGVFKTGVRMGLRLTWNKVRYCKIDVPAPEIAEALATFLDCETGLIDGLIEKKTRFIALLKEKRAAVITHAVTKGIDPDATMKEGPFKAIGMVPESWDISPVGRALRVKKNTVGSRHSEYKLLSLTTRGVIERDISENFGKFPEFFDSYQEVRPGDFVFCLFDIDETPRTVGLSDRHGMITGAYSVFDCLAPIYSKYLYFLFLHLDMCKGLKPFYTGLRKTIRPPKFTSIRIPFPPEDDARRIVEHIETQTAKIDGLIALTERSIDLLREKRAALITTAVTGKIDVRRAA